MTEEERKERRRIANKKYRESHKEQAKEYHKVWREKNREHINAKAREKYKENPQSFKDRQERYNISHQEQLKEKRRKYKIENRNKVTAYEKNRRKEPIYKLKTNIRTLIKNSFKYCSHRKNTKTEQILGCTVDEFITYLQSKFKEGMTLENHGEWHIDHIIPISSAKNEMEVIKLNHYTNLQPLWAKENLKKGKKIL